MGEDDDQFKKDFNAFQACFGMVGEFLWHWATLEREMQKALALALELDLRQTLILSSNTQLRDKINILKTAASTANRRNATAAIKLLNEIANQTPKRNMMAHDFFYPSPKTPAVQFHAIKAKGHFDLPVTLWTPDDFQAAYDQIEGLRDRLEQLRSAFRPRRTREAQRVLETFHGILAHASADEDFPSRPPQSRRGSRKATRKKLPRNPRG